MILSKCATSGSKKSRFIKNQEANRLSSILGLKTPLSKVPILSNILFWNATPWSAAPLNIWNEWNNKQVFISHW